MPRGVDEAGKFPEMAVSFSGTDSGVDGGVTGLILSGVRETGKEIGVGSYGRVFEVDYCGTKCAAKEVHRIFICEASPGGSKRVKENFLRECQHCAGLRHPNVVQFLGVYYRDGTPAPVPIMVMEKMDESLRSSLERHAMIPLTVKLCILLDVSLGLRWVCMCCSYQSVYVASCTVADMADNSSIKEAQ